MAKYKLTRTDKNKWVTNLKRFAAGLGLMYVGQLMLTAGAEGHIFSLKDLEPSMVTRGGMIYYVLSATQDLFYKWSKA